MWNYSLKSLKYFLKKLGTFLICIHLEGTFGITQPNKLAVKIISIVYQNVDSIVGISFGERI